MQKHAHLPLAEMLASGRAAEADAAKLPHLAHFGRRLAHAFPSLFRHPDVRPSRQMLVASEQWSFTLSSVTVLVKWHRGKGGHWTFTAWDDSHKLSERDSFAFSHPSADVALLAFVGDALAMTAQREKVAA